MSFDSVSRRSTMTSLGVAAAAFASQSANAQTLTDPLATIPAFAARHQPKPLRFDPSRLSGLSERLITSHHENNYGGSVRALNMIEARLAAALSDTDFPAVVYGGLKREQLHRTGSVVLHEIYFDGLGGNGQPGGAVRAALIAAFGSFDHWESDFRRTALSLAGGSGWCVLAYNLHTRSLHNYWAPDHMHAASAGAPLLALDMYEHSFHLDYGAAAAKYVDAFFRNIDWEIVESRFVSAQKWGL